MSDPYRVDYYSPMGSRETLQISSLTAARKVGEIGSCTLSVKPIYPPGYFQADGQILIYRSLPGGSPYLLGDTAWFMRRPSWKTNSNGEKTVEISAQDSIGLLKRRKIAYFGGNVYTNKTDTADNIMKAIVRENYGTLVFDANRNLSSNISVQANSSNGPAISVDELQWRGILETLSELSKASIDLGIPIYFDLVCTGYDQFEFRTYYRLIGTDRTTPGNLLTLSRESNTLMDAEVTLDYNEEINYVYSKGAGEGSASFIKEVYDAARINISAYNRWEGFVNDSNAKTDNALIAAGRNALAMGRPKLIFGGTVAQTQTLRFGAEYNYGDYLYAKYESYTMPCMLDAFSVKWDRDNGEQLDLKVHGEFYVSE